ncbi:hypothetical protein OG782_36550 [Streptomyces sp. NBC_00876]|uniref:hypothetical protein n=1 Tax=Streptomyces sp. NBC_00876 TaxID=2975853 RepID=UPI00386F0615|nr:hypothetical protein OG782_36550 [Streptomyces sp. NBC_00876]
MAAAREAAIVPCAGTPRDEQLLSRATVTPAPPKRAVPLVRRGDRVLTPPEQAFADLVRAPAE